MRRAIPCIAGLLMLATAGSVLGANNPDQLWKEYLLALGRKDYVDILQCYSKEVRAQLGDQKSVRSRRMLNDHMEQMFKLLLLDHKWEIKDKQRKGTDGLVFTIELREKKKPNRKTKGIEPFERQVEFVREDFIWKISAPPVGGQTASLVEMGAVKMVAGIAIALGVLIFLGKKLFA